MTEMRIVIHDEHRDFQPDRPWTACIEVGDGITPEEVANGGTPVIALLALMSKCVDLLENEPTECPDCGHVIQSEAWRGYHDDEGNCHAYRAPR